MGDILRRALYGKLPLTMEEVHEAERYEARRATVRRTNHGFLLVSIETKFDGVVDVLFETSWNVPMDIVVLKGIGGLVVIGRYFRVDDILSELEYEGRVVSGSEGTMISYWGAKKLEEVTEIVLRLF